MLATEWWTKYNSDIFFRARVNVILLQVAFGIAVFVVFWLALIEVQENIASAIANGISDLISKDTEAVSAEYVLTRIEEARAFEFSKLFFLALVFGVLFGYFISRATLSPARSALAAQKRFIGNIAHELRTPLSVIKTNMEVLLMGGALDTETRETVSDTVSEVDRASEIINNILSLDPTLSPNKLEFRNVDFGDIAESAVGKIAALARNQKLEVMFRKRGEYRMVVGNGTALEQITINLLKNSIEHTKEGGRITVTVEPDYRGFVEMQVRDTGSGIQREDLFHIFDPYYRSIGARTRKDAAGTSGLGLTIVSEIVKAHHGKVSVYSVLGRGTTVTVKIPCPPSTTAEKKRRSKSPSSDEVFMDFSSPLF